MSHRPRPPLLIYFILAQFAICLLAWAQPYEISWHTVDGGGGTSTGGMYMVSGTIGQFDAAAPLTSGHFAVTGGFWAIPQAVQNRNAPTLQIVPATPGSVIVSWMPDSPGFVLQETLSVSPTNWTNSPSSHTNPIVVPITVPTKFYRLHKP